MVTFIDASEGFVSCRVRERSSYTARRTDKHRNARFRGKVKFKRVNQIDVKLLRELKELGQLPFWLNEYEGKLTQERCGDIVIDWRWIERHENRKSKWYSRFVENY